MGIFKKFTTKELVFIALMAALGTVVSYFTTAMNVVTGIPLSSFLSPLILPIFFVITALVIRKFLTVTLLNTIWAVLIIPSPALGGPGLHKIPLLIIVGLIFDIVFYMFRDKEKLSSVLAGACSIAVVPWLTVFFGVMLGLPGIDKLRAMIWMITLMGIVVAIVGSFVGVYLWKKIKNKKIIKQLTS